MGRGPGFVVLLFDLELREPKCLSQEIGGKLGPLSPAKSDVPRYLCQDQSRAHQRPLEQYVDEAYARSCAPRVWLRCLNCKKSAEQDSRQASCMRRWVLGYPRSTVLYITVQYPKGGTESVPSPTGMVRDTAQREKSPGQLIAKNKHGQILQISSSTSAHLDLPSSIW